ncbi:rod-binding protein [Eubacterium sp. MSJ-33]|uniref:rod-binding protein n=1 Tax=Eubacterium sp. MSJ-33 TaxID=2841528 RepID=UPI001C77220C|nr:rod-binding protein [Eubacterium sp. MSJ-33]QWT52179.1 rod-binding protein [Eubacterium sp. MSJ-33]
MENITNLTNKDYSSYVSQAQVGNLTNQIKRSSSADATDEEMMAACKEFEAYLVEQVYKQVQSTIKSDDSDDNPYADYAYDLQAQQYAKLVSDQGKLGLAQQLYESMKKQNAAITPEELHEMEQAATVANAENA